MPAPLRPFNIGMIGFISDRGQRTHLMVKTPLDSMLWNLVPHQS